MATSAGGLDKSDGSERTGRLLTWTATILACAYFAWIGGSLYYSTPVLVSTFTRFRPNFSRLRSRQLYRVHDSYPPLFSLFINMFEKDGYLPRC